MSLRSAIAFAALALFSAIAGGAGPAPPPAAAESTVPGEVLVRFKPDPSGLELRVVTSRLALFASAKEFHYDPYADIWTLRFETQPVGDVIAGLAADPGVDLAQPDYVYEYAAEPNDEMYSTRQRPYLAAINAPAAWEIEAGDPSVEVAVIDGGVDIDHPELEDRIWTNNGDPVDGLDNDGNGCIDDLHGCSFQSFVPDGSVEDLDGHGTFVAGIIAAKRDNGEGIAGISAATIMPVRALGAKGKGKTAQLVASIRYAAANGADIINLSLALDPDNPKCPTDPAVSRALAAAVNDYGATIIAAAGNSAFDCVAYPAASDDAIAVSASGPSERPDIKAFFSNYGPEVDVTAPGIGLVSTCPMPTAVPTEFCPGAPYGSGDGTSFSTPIVSGIAALLLAQDRGMTRQEIEWRLKTTAYPLPDDQHANWDGAGRVDAARALGSTSTYVNVDLALPTPAEMGVSLAVMGAGGVECQVGLWDEQADGPEVLDEVFHRPSISGTLGVSHCASYWPPTPARPWRLLIDNHGPKAVLLNAWSAVSLTGQCESGGGPVFVSGGHQGSSDIKCDGALSNDHIGGAVPVDMGRLPLRFDVDLRHATTDGDVKPSCISSNGVGFSRTVWYKLEGSALSDGVTVDAFGSESDLAPQQQTVKTMIAVYRADPGGLQEVACGVRFFPGKAIESRVIWRTEANATYYVMAGAYQIIPMGVLRLNISPVDLPENDSIDGAVPISLADAYPVVQPAILGTADGADPGASCMPLYVNSLWFKVSEPAGQDLVFTTTGSDYNTAAAVFRREAGGVLTEVACNNNEAATVLTSRVQWQCDGGDYYVVVGAFANIGVGVLRADLQSP